MRIAILAVHGVLPIARHVFQDRVASALRLRLDQISEDSCRWMMSSVYTQPGQSPKLPPLDAPAIVRIHRMDDDPAEPTHDVFDVEEVYWSPLVHGKTNAGAVLLWLLMTVLNPVATTARCRERPAKALFDAVFIIVALLLIAALFAGAAMLAVFAWLNIASLSANHVPLWQKLPFWRGLLVGLAAACAFALAVRSLVAIFANFRALLVVPVQFWSRILAVFVLLFLAGSGLAWSSILMAGEIAKGIVPAAELVGAIAVALGAFALLQWFLIDFFGPVQIYMTRDEAAPFFRIRETVTALFMESLLAALQRSRDGIRYDRVYVVAHSLGSTIAMDGILRIFDLSRTEADLAQAFERIRGFVSFGTALEKTKYFFDATRESFSQRYGEWQDDLYGPVFTADRRSLERDRAHAIFWLNCCYFSDIISDAIASFRSVNRLVARNRQRFGNFALWHPITHEDYLFDPWFWLRKGACDIGVIDVITSGLTVHAPPATAAESLE